MRRWSRQHQQGERAAGVRGERKPARYYVVEAAGLPHLADDRGERAAAQRLLHGPQDVAHACRRHGDEALGLKADLVEAEPVRVAAFAQAHVFGDPQHRTARPLGRKRKREAGGGRDLRFAGGRDLVQDTHGQAAAQNLVDCKNADPLGRGMLERGAFALDRHDRPAQGIELAAAAPGVANA